MLREGPIVKKAWHEFLYANQGRPRVAIVRRDSGDYMCMEWFGTSDEDQRRQRPTKDRHANRID